MGELKMKAITLHQPWATLVAVGAKTYETRSWLTHHRGPLAIHAAKTKEHERLCFTDPFYTALQNANQTARWLPYGAMVAICNITSVVECTADRMAFLTYPESEFGDFSAGRFAWRLAAIQKFPFPMVVRGRQRLWTWDFSDRPDYQIAYIQKYLATYEWEG